MGILGQMWYLIVSIPDLCTLAYFVYGVSSIQQVSHSEGSGKISLTLLQYENTQCLDAQGNCCDGINIPSVGCTPGCCDHQFTISLSDLDG